MAITFSQEIFEKICSSATNSTAEVYDMIAPHLDDTLQSINCVLLGDMADKLDTVPGLEQAVHKTGLSAYLSGADTTTRPGTDPTGFGVVSNSESGPSSADRVKNLLQQVTNAAEDTYDRCLELLVGTSWADTAQARINIPNLMYTAKQLKMYVDFPSADVHRSKLLEFRTKMYQAEERYGSTCRPSSSTTSSNRPGTMRSPKKSLPWPTTCASSSASASQRTGRQQRACWNASRTTRNQSRGIHQLQGLRSLQSQTFPDLSE